MERGWFKLELYVPVTHVEALKDALAAAGAGAWGKYDHCFWQTSGTGEFRPLAGSAPLIGTHGEIARVPEVKLETLCPAGRVGAVVAALRRAHPYEVPAFYLLPVRIDAPEEEKTKES